MAMDIRAIRVKLRQEQMGTYHLQRLVEVM